MRTIIASILCVLPILFFVVAPVRAERPTMTALRVPDNVITIDGRDDDWRRLGDTAMDRSRATSSEKGWMGTYIERGAWAGPDDCSITAWLAADSDNLYLLADVHDEFLINSSDAANPYLGDDFELFVEAGPVEGRIVAKSENYRQIIFVPGRINALWPKPFLWQPEKNPGVVVASRMRPWGYTIEVKMPKALWPYWKAHPDLESIGVDLMACEADAPGVDIHHPALKGAMFLFSKGHHYETPANIGQANFEKDVTPLTDTKSAAAPDADDAMVLLHKAATDESSADTAAQAVLDTADDARAAEIAAAAIDSPLSVVRNAGLIVLGQHPELDAPIDRIIPLLTPAPAPPRAGAAPASTEPVILDRAEHIRRAIPRYAMMTLAERHKMPAVDLFDAYGKPADDPAMRLTYIWYAGINGDRTVTPKLIPLLSDPNLRVRMLTAMVLGMFRDPAAIEPLRALSQTDSWDSAKAQAKQSIEQIEKAIGN